MHGAHRRCWQLEAGLGTEEEKQIPNIEVWEQAQEGWGLLEGPRWEPRWKWDDGAAAHPDQPSGAEPSPHGPRGLAALTASVTAFSTSSSLPDAGAEHRGCRNSKCLCLEHICT